MSEPRRKSLIEGLDGFRTDLRRSDDPDETEGRALYRAHADGLASAQMAIARRRVSLRQSP